MVSILESFLSYGLIENIDGNDERYTKIEQAAIALAQDFRENPELLVSAIVSGLNPEVTLSDQYIIKAKECLQEEWRAYSTAYTDEPINLFRGMILDACSRVSEDDFNASVMWLSASDVLPLLTLGKEEKLLSEFMTLLSQQAESNCIQDDNLVKLQKEKVIKFDGVQELSRFREIEIDRDKLFEQIGAASGPSYVDKTKGNVAGNNPNPHWAQNGAQNWTGAFADRMSETIADVLENVATKLTKNNNDLKEGLVKYKQELNKSLEKVLNEQRLNTQRQLKETLAIQTQEQTRLNVLWWSEALYSSPLNSSYREYSAEIASTLMPFDLLEEITVPVPASVGYMLSETVNKLTNVNFEQQLNFHEFLTSLRDQKVSIDSGWLDNLQIPEINSSLNIRDLIILTLKAEPCDLESLLKNSVVPEQWECSLPTLSRIIFKQEQAHTIIRNNT